MHAVISDQGMLKCFPNTDLSIFTRGQNHHHILLSTKEYSKALYPEADRLKVFQRVTRVLYDLIRNFKTFSSGRNSWSSLTLSISWRYRSAMSPAFS